MNRDTVIKIQNVLKAIEINLEEPLDRKTIISKFITMNSLSHCQRIKPFFQLLLTKFYTVQENSLILIKIQSDSLSVSASPS